MVSHPPQQSHKKTSNTGIAIMVLVIVTLLMSLWWVNVTAADSSFVLSQASQNTAVQTDWLTPLLLTGGIVLLMGSYLAWRRR
ncbi:MAG: hypothetical protein KDD89_01180 [Anaerolineales bacterium]|nr:hypothetical protein [Anaerolineales bacterium]